MAEFEKNKLIPIFKRLDETLARSGTGYFVGSKVFLKTRISVYDLLNFGKKASKVAWRF